MPFILLFYVVSIEQRYLFSFGALYHFLFFLLFSNFQLIAFVWHIIFSAVVENEYVVVNRKQILATSVYSNQFDLI